MVKTVDGIVGFEQRYASLAQKIKKNQIGTMFIKPGYFPNDPWGRPLQKTIEGHLISSQIDILETTELMLTPKGVKNLYYGIFNDPEPSRTLIQLRKGILDHLSNASILCYLLSGDDVVNKVNVIKFYIRSQYGVTESTDVRNILHTPEVNEVMHDVNMFFLYRTEEYIIARER